MSIEVRNLTYIYNEGSPFETKALDNINLKIHDGEQIGLIGHTGSGKSTLIQHFNALLKPSSGEVIIDGINIWEKKVNKTQIRQKIGLVFQYPENQLFEETVFKDIAFGPKNLGVPEKEIPKRVDEALRLVGLSDDIKNKSPFDLSGGQKRRVAIAGVLAMKPQVLILDEPTAGLDPRGRNEILTHIKKMARETKITIITVSHNMEEIAQLAERIIVINGGKIILDGSTRDVFMNTEILENCGLSVPQVKYLIKELRLRGWKIDERLITIQEVCESILKELGKYGVNNKC